MKFLFGVCLGALLGAIIEGMRGQPKMITIIVFGSLTLLFGSILGINWLSKKFWPNREKWWATSSYDSWAITQQENPQNALSDNRGQIWRSPLTQAVGNWFEIDMRKERMINRIQFTSDNSDIEKPKKWRMMFYGEDANKQKQTLGHKDGQYNISVQSKDIPNRIRWFRVEIKEVAEDMSVNSNYSKRNDTTKVYWTISLVNLWEYRFSIFGRRFCEHEL